MLDNYSAMDISNKNCFTNNQINRSLVNESVCPVKLEASYINSSQKFPLSEILTNNDTDRPIFSNESLNNGTLKSFIQTATSFSLTYNVRVDYNSYR